ncbi:MAG TPA: PKD domain-containing protein [Vicinamibacterales bacterium]|nr:PKD domain-containing protein [Vicinamibacterales bacterium]
MHKLKPFAVFLCLSLAACGGGSKGSSTPTTPTSPTTPTTPTNRAPVINSMDFSPSFGIMGLTTFLWSANASDPDGDAVSYDWDIAGNPHTGATGAISFSNGGTGTARLTVTDSHGAAASDTRSFVVGDMTGTWIVTSGELFGSSFRLTQSPLGTVTGGFTLPGLGNGNTDPAQPGHITAGAALTMRVKLAPFTDFTMNGVMDTTGRRVNGSLQGSGFTGESFTMTKQ